METMRIEIVNKKAKRILMDLADLKLIKIKGEDPIKSFQDLLNKLRARGKTPSIEEITKEIELVRARRHGKKN